jgi:hypothetical protein
MIPAIPLAVLGLTFLLCASTLSAQPSKHSEGPIDVDAPGGARARPTSPLERSRYTTPAFSSLEARLSRDDTLDSIRPLVSWAAFLVAAAAAAIVVVLGDVTRRLIRSRSAWPAFVWSVITTLFLAYLIDMSWKGLDAFLILSGACILFCTALGAHELLLSVRRRSHAAVRDDGGHPAAVSWRSSWLA